MTEPITLQLPPEYGPQAQTGGTGSSSGDDAEPVQIFDAELLKILTGRARSQLVPSLGLLKQSRDLTSEGHVNRFLMLITELVLGENGILLALPDNTPSRTRSAWEFAEERFSASGESLRQFQEALVFSLIRDGDAHILTENPSPELIDSAAVEYPQERPMTEFTTFDDQPDRTADGYVVKTDDEDRFISAINIIQIKHVKDRIFERGIPWIAYAIPIINALDQYASSFLTGADRANKMPMYGTIPENAPPAVRDKLEEEGMPVRSDRIPFLVSGVEFHDLDLAKNFDGASYADIRAAKLSSISASLGGTYDFVSGDVSRANMSSLQSANLTNQAFIKIVQRMIGDATKRMFVRWLLNGIANRLLPASSLNINIRDVKQRRPRVASVIPHREAQVDKILIDSQVVSSWTIAEERGYDYEEELTRMAEQTRRIGVVNGDSNDGSISN